MKKPRIDSTAEQSGTRVDPGKAVPSTGDQSSSQGNKRKTPAEVTDFGGGGSDTGSVVEHRVDPIVQETVYQQPLGTTTMIPTGLQEQTKSLIRQVDHVLSTMKRPKKANLKPLIDLMPQLDAAYNGYMDAFIAYN